ncbi:MAG TPA: gamma-glutamyltransferase [Alphaproteobacteria bacterium]|nr:gamma-glutamyltransferase [Alphaproteobacteria bacterium]
MGHISPVFSRSPKACAPRRAVRLGAALITVFSVAACDTVPREETTPTADEAGFALKGGREAAIAQRHMVASANPVASRIGRGILRKGGSALDAAIAMQAALTLVEPQSSGIGGGGFLMHFDAGTGQIEAYEGREAAPGAAKETLFLHPDGKPMADSRFRVGGISAAVPGSLRMLEVAHKRHGKLPWADLFRPAIDLARRGFRISPRMHASVARDPFLAEYPKARAYFFGADGKPKPVGTLLRNPELAATLRAVAKEGSRALHQGPIARDIAEAVQGDNRRPGLMTERDIAAYQAKGRPSICGPYRGWLVCGFGPPTSGGVATVMTLALLERFDLASLKPSSAEAVHLISEAMKLANADRIRYVADPDAVPVPIAQLLDRDYLARRSRLIRTGVAMKTAKPGTIPMMAQARPGWAASDDGEQPSTTHMSVIDKNGNAVAMTSSIGSAFGSRLMIRGFMLNNHATDFSQVPRTPSGRPKVNRPGPDKRPRSSQSPTLVFDPEGRLAYALGSPGGMRIIAFVVKTVIGVIDWKLDIQEAINLPNHAVRRGRIDLERGTALEAIAPKLRALGHRVRIRRLTSGIQGIARVRRRLEGGADPRREGLALGD